MCGLVFLRDGVSVPYDPTWRQQLLADTGKTIIHYNLTHIRWVLAMASHLLTPEQRALIRRERDFLTVRAKVAKATN